MQAKDIMTTNVATVGTDDNVQDVAKKLIAVGVSALPVIDKNGKLVGIVSEGDLVGRRELERAERSEWWLTMFAEGEALNPEFLASIKPQNRKVHDVMTSPVVTVTETTDTTDIAKLLVEKNVKRAPVLRDGKIVGIVSRADLVRALAET